MNYRVTSTSPLTQASDYLIIGVGDDHNLGNIANQLNQACDHFIDELLSAKDINTKRGETCVIHQGLGSPARRVIIAGLGDGLNDPQACREIGEAIGKKLLACQAKDCLIALELNDVNHLSHLSIGLSLANYRFDQCKSQPAPTSSAPETVFFVEESAQTQVSAALAATPALAAGLFLTRDLGNLPPNIADPAYLAEQALAMRSPGNKLSVDILERAQMQDLGMGALLSVSQGSRRPPKLIVMNYQGGQTDAAPVVLVGKGVTFDTGGISLKPGAAMDEMKYDMCGAASVLGVMRACVDLQLPLNVIGVVPSVENMIGGDATRPGDIVTSMSGQTIEVLNTDAEGRLILCDALTYVARFKPRVVIDIATLTGACIIALGKYHSGLMSNDQALADALLNAGRQSGDTCWQLPMEQGYQDTLDSNFADMANIGHDRSAGATTAACFLSRFTKQYHWAHLDIAGTAWHSGAKKGATGRPVTLLMHYLQSLC